MRLATLAGPAGRPQTAAVVDDRALPLEALAVAGHLDERLARLDLVALLAADPELAATHAALDRARARDPGWIPLAAVRLLAPLARPGKIVCVGFNYRDHVSEQKIEPPDRPLLFAKFANAVVADGAPIVHHAATHALDLEAELAVVVGRTARRIRAEEAHAHIAGYTVVNDVTARDLQGTRQALGPGERGDGQWLRAKGSDSFLPMGPVLVTADEIGDPARLALRSWRTPAEGPDAGREVVMQSGSTADMIFGVPEILEFVSAVITLEPGDVIATGTPAGVGVFRDPPVFLKPGDVARVEVETIGSLANPVVDAEGEAPPGSPAALMLAERATAARSG